MLADKFYYANSFKAWQVPNTAEGRAKVDAFIQRHYGSKTESSGNDNKLRLAKARAKAIIIRQRQRSRNGVKGINYEMD